MLRTTRKLKSEIDRLNLKTKDLNSATKKKITKMETKRMVTSSKCRSYIKDNMLPKSAKYDKWVKAVAEHLSWLREFRDAAIEDLASAFDDADKLKLQLGNLSPHRPSTTEGWLEFQAISGSVVREKIDDLAKTSPNKIVDMYCKAVRLGDHTTAFAVELFGVGAITSAQQDLGAGHSSQRLYHDALRDLNDLVDRAIPERLDLKSQIEGIESKLNEAERELKAYQTPEEVESIMTRFNVGTSFSRIAPFYYECGVGYIDDRYRARQIEIDALVSGQSLVESSVRMLPPNSSIQARIQGGIRAIEKDTE